MHRIAVAGFLALGFALGVPAASQSLSPDGKLLAISAPAFDPTDKSTSVSIYDTGCLIAHKPPSACTTRSNKLSGRLPRRFDWASDGLTVIASTQERTLLSLADTSAPPRNLRWYFVATPRVFDAGNRLFLDPVSEDYPPEPDVNSKNDDEVINGHGERVGYWGDVIRNRTGQSITIPLLVNFEAPLSAPLYAKRAIYPATTGERFWFYSNSMGNQGLLVEFSPGAMRQVSLPKVQGPAAAVLDAMTGEPIALQGGFAIYPLDAAGRSLDWLTDAVEKTRRDDPGLEVLTTSVSSAGRIAAIRFFRAPGCTEDHLLTPTAQAVIGSSCAAPASAKSPGYSVAPVTIPGAFPLTARLYRTNTPRDSIRGLMIYFHGGPPQNSLHGGMPPELFLDPSLDVLAVEYRGSSGLGEGYLTALKQPVADISAEDLRAAIDWARVQPEYRKRLVGFWGVSWGGVAGHAILSRNTSGLDFMVSDSGFVENSAGANTTRCSSIDWRAGIFGTMTDDKGVCRYNPTGINTVPVTSKVPVFFLVGGKDNILTPIAITMAWAERAISEGACVSMATSAEGTHTIGSWPEESRSKAVTALKTWINDIAAGRSSQCNAQLSLH